MPKRSFSQSHDSDVIDMQTGRPVQVVSRSAISEQLRNLRLENGMQQKELAAQLGVTGNAVTNWEAGRARPDINLLPELAHIFGVSVDELFGLPAPSTRPTEVESLFRQLNEGHRSAVLQLMRSLLTEQRVIRPLTTLTYIDRPLAAGVGDPTELLENTETIVLVSSPVVESADYVFPVSGESMEPEFHNGDMVLVKKLSSIADMAPGTVGAFMIGNETYIKVYEKDGLHSYNPRFSTIPSTGDTPVYLIGRVTGKVQDDWIPTRQELADYQATH